VLVGGEIPDLTECIDATSIRVYAPGSFFFLCGGKYDILGVTSISLRDAFLKICNSSAFKSRMTLIAEDVNAFFPNANYKDILSLESDIAQIADLVLLFSESYGSVAELGAFSVTEEIARRLLVFIDDKSYNEDSFIKLGPLRSLENKYGEVLPVLTGHRL
jgi:hypothetical protein